MKTNRSVWEEMKSISGIRLQSPLIKSIYKVNYIWFTIYSVLCFSPYMYFLSVKVIREKKKLKVLMKAMGLQDIAFWSVAQCVEVGLGDLFQPLRFQASMKREFLVTRWQVVLEPAVHHLHRHNVESAGGNHGWRGHPRPQLFRNIFPLFFPWHCVGKSAFVFLNDE